MQKTQCMGAYVKHNFSKESIVVASIIILIIYFNTICVNLPQLSVHLKGSNFGRIRKLTNFEKHHHEPDRFSDAALEFIRRIGHEDVKRSAELLYQEIRRQFAYKRRDFNYICEDGFASIKTPDFEIEIRIDQGIEVSEPKNYCISTVVKHMYTIEILQDERFIHCFNGHCDQIIVQFPQVIDLRSKIDQIEAIEEFANFLDYAPDASSFDLKLSDQDLHIQVTEMQMSFRLLTYPNLKKLLNHSQRAFEILTKKSVIISID